MMTMGRNLSSEITNLIFNMLQISADIWSISNIPTSTTFHQITLRNCWESRARYFLDHKQHREIIKLAKPFLSHYHRPFADDEWASSP